MLNEIKESFINDKKYYIIAGVLLIVGIIFWNMRSNSNVSTDGITADTVREQYKSVGTELDRTGQAIAESRGLVTEIRQTSNDIKREIDDSRSIDKSDAELIKDSQRILREVRTSGKVQN